MLKSMSYYLDYISKKSVNGKVAGISVSNTGR